MAAERIGIGALLQRLQPDFPDISISKIRFLESEGLVTPSRTSSGYRKYSQEDIERLEFVLTAQRDRFWPLKVIREQVDRLEQQGGLPEAAAAAEQGGGAASAGDRLSEETALAGWAASSSSPETGLGAAPDAEEGERTYSMRELARLPQPFTTSQARQAWGTTRRVAIPLLEHLDARGWTRREDGTTRSIVR